jgi:WD40 repeat protein
MPIIAGVDAILKKRGFIMMKKILPIGLLAVFVLSSCQGGQAAKSIETVTPSNLGTGSFLPTVAPTASSTPTQITPTATPTPALDTLSYFGTPMGIAGNDPITRENLSEIRRLSVWSEPYIKRITISPDNRWLALSSDDAVYLYNLSTYALHEIYDAYDISFSPDGTIAALASGGKVKVFQFNEGDLQLVSILEDSGTPVISPDNSTVAIWGDPFNELKLWDASTGALRYKLEGHKYYIQDVRFTPDSQTLLSASPDSIRMWNVSDGANIRTNEHTGQGVRFHPSGEIMAVWAGSQITLRRVDDGNVLLTLPATENPWRSMVFSADGSLLASADGYVWSIPDGNLVVKYDSEDLHPILAFTADNKYLIDCLGLPVRFQNLTDGTDVRTLDPLPDWSSQGADGYHWGCDPAAISPDDNTMACAGHKDEKFSLGLFQISDGSLIKTYESLKGPWKVEGGSTTIYFNSIQFSPDGKTLAWAMPGLIQLWDVESGERIRSIEIEESESYGLFVFSPDLATCYAGVNGKIHAWSLSDGTRTGIFKTSEFISPVGYSAESNLLIAMTGWSRFPPSPPRQIILIDPGDGTLRGSIAIQDDMDFWYTYASSKGDFLAIYGCLNNSFTNCPDDSYAVRLFTIPEGEVAGTTTLPSETVGMDSARIPACWRFSQGMNCFFTPFRKAKF